MDSVTFDRLSSLPPLSRAQKEHRKCKICGFQAPFFDLVDFNKHCSADPYAYGISGIVIPYYRCSYCKLLFTDFIDSWTTEEISRFIYNGDYVKVDPAYLGERPRKMPKRMSRLLRGSENLSILDYGSGSGLFAREMMARGYSKMFCYDPFSQSVRLDGKFDLITCFEVIEHSPEPMTTLRDMLSLLHKSGAIIIGQTAQPANIEEIRGRWWYLAPRNGHVSTFAKFTFWEMARREGLEFQLGGSLFGFAQGDRISSIETVLARVGPKYSVEILGAPLDGAADPAQWHRPEKSGDASFRWTASAEVDLGAANSTLG